MDERYKQFIEKRKNKKCFRCGKKTIGYMCRECYSAGGTRVTTSRNRHRKKEILEIIKDVNENIF
jgi:hypothetical protein